MKKRMVIQLSRSDTHGWNQIIHRWLHDTYLERFRGPL